MATNNNAHVERPTFPPSDATADTQQDSSVPKEVLKSLTFGLNQLEEIRTLLADILQLNARIYDYMAADMHEDKEQTWKHAFTQVKESGERLDTLRASLGGSEDDKSAAA